MLSPVAHGTSLVRMTPEQRAQDRKNMRWVVTYVPGAVTFIIGVPLAAGSSDPSTQRVGIGLLSAGAVGLAVAIAFHVRNAFFSTASPPGGEGAH